MFKRPPQNRSMQNRAVNTKTPKPPSGGSGIPRSSNTVDYYHHHLYYDNTPSYNDSNNNDCGGSSDSGSGSCGSGW